MRKLFSSVARSKTIGVVLFTLILPGLALLGFSSSGSKIVQHKHAAANLLQLTDTLELPDFKLPYEGEVFWTGGPHGYLQGSDFTGYYTLGEGSGLDFSNGSNFQVLAMADGIVIEADCVGNDTFGCQVAIQHDVGGSVLVYAHLEPSSMQEIIDRFNQAEQAGVSLWAWQGVVLGNAGNSGDQEATHLHIELRGGQKDENGNWICRLQCLPENLGGSPIGWGEGLPFVDGYRIWSYILDQDDPFRAYNYEGSAVIGDVNIIYDFPFLDMPTYERKIATVVRVDPSFQCDPLSDSCEDNDQSTLTQFAGHGSFDVGQSVSTRHLATTTNQLSGRLISSNIPSTFPPPTPAPANTATPTSTTVPANGIELCDGANYGSPCQTYTYDNDDYCINLAGTGMDNRAESLRFRGSYVGNYDVVAYGDNACAEYNARYDSDVPDFGGGLNNQFSSIRIERKQPAGDGVEFCDGTNYGPPCQTYTHDNNDKCMYLDSLDNRAESIRFKDGYIGNYEVVGYGDSSCNTYNGRWGSDMPDLGGLNNQLSSIRIEILQPTINKWDVQYFDNTDLSGSPKCAEQVDAFFAKNWTDKPCNDIPANENWSAKFVGTFNFDSGNYYFRITHDDGARLCCGDGPSYYYYNWDTPGSVWVGPYSISGSKTLYLEYRQFLGSAHLSFDWTTFPEPTATPIATSTPTPTPTPTPNPDGEPPTVLWIAPVSNEQVYHVGDEVIQLEASATDNVAVSRVRFYRWDAVNEQYLEIGNDYTAPYQMSLDSSTLNYYWNNIFAKAYDTAGSVSDRQWIWLYRNEPTSTSVHKVFLPFIGRNFDSSPPATATPTATSVSTQTSTPTPTPTPTNTPTNTPTPTSTPTSTPTPSLTPTPGFPFTITEFPIVTSDGNQTAKDMAYNNTDNEYLAVWEDDRDDGIYAQRLDGSGIPLDSGNLIFVLSPDHSCCRLAFNPVSYEYLLIYTLITNPSPEYKEVRGQKIASDGTPLGQEIVISVHNNTSNFRVIGAFVTGQGQYFIVWYEWNHPGGGSWDIVGRLVDANGTPIGDEIDISTTPNDPDYRLAITYNPVQDEILVVRTVWCRDPQVVEGQRISGNGTLIGGWFQITTVTGYPGGTCAVVRLSSHPITGEYLFLWDKNDSSDLWGSILSPTGSPNTPFSIQPGAAQSPGAMYVWSENKYLVEWFDQDHFGHLVAPDGTLPGSSFVIPSTYGVTGALYNPTAGTYLRLLTVSSNGTGDDIYGVRLSATTITLANRGCPIHQR